MIRKLLALALALLVPSVAHAAWHEASSAHFVVYANDSPERVQRLAADLERFDQAVRILRGIPNAPVGPANRLNVYVVGALADVWRLAGSESVAGFYIGRAGGSLAIVPRRIGSGAEDLPARAVLFHEYSHHLMAAAYAQVAFPSWMVEGWAEFHGTARILEDGGVLFGDAPRHRAYALAGNALPIQRILRGDVQRLSGEQVDAFYGRGWALTHYLTFEPSRIAQFDQYLDAINQGRTPEQASEVFGDLRVLHREVERYLRRRRLPGRTVMAWAINVGEIAVRPLTPGEEATMAVRIRSKVGVTEETAPGVYADARRAAAPFPDDPGAQIVLAEAAYDAKDYAGAEAAADRALAANPNAIGAILYKAMTRLAVATVAGTLDAPSARAIRGLIVRGNRIDPDHPELLVLYYRTYAESGVTPPELARTGLYRAFELAPQDRGLRMLAAQVLLADGNAVMARVLLRPLANDPHGGGMGAVAREMIARIDGGASEAPESGTSEDDE